MFMCWYIIIEKGSVSVFIGRCSTQIYHLIVQLTWQQTAPPKSCKKSDQGDNKCLVRKCEILTLIYFAFTVYLFFFMPVWFSWFHPPNNISSTITLPLETLSPDPFPLTEPIAVTLSSLGPGPLGTSPDCCLPGTYFLCPIPPSSHPKVPPPAGTGATLRTSTTRLDFVLACTADSI